MSRVNFDKQYTHVHVNQYMGQCTRFRFLSYMLVIDVDEGSDKKLTSSLSLWALYTFAHIRICDKYRMIQTTVAARKQLVSAVLQLQPVK